MIALDSSVLIDVLIADPDYADASETAIADALAASDVVVCDAGPFVTNADKNCTWTIMALSWRTSEHLADEMKKGNV